MSVSDILLSSAVGGLVVGTGFNADHRERCRNDHSAEDVGNAVGHYSMCEVLPDWVRLRRAAWGLAVKGGNSKSHCPTWSAYKRKTLANRLLCFRCGRCRNAKHFNCVVILVKTNDLKLAQGSGHGSSG